MKYVGTGLPKFTKASLVRQVRDYDKGDVRNWYKLLRKYSDLKGREFDALDLMRAYKKMRMRTTSVGRIPCVAGIYCVLSQMLTTEVATALNRNVNGDRCKISSGRQLFNSLGYRGSWGGVCHDTPTISKVNSIIRVLENARG